MKILIITGFFPPQNSIASWRPYSWAKYWSRIGHDVTVLTVKKGQSPSDSFANEGAFKVIEVPLPYRWIRDSFKKKAPPSNIDKKGTKIRGFLPLFWDRIKNKYGIFASCRMPDHLDIWWRFAFNKVKREKWDLVVSTAGPYSVHSPAFKLKKDGKAKIWIADWRDLWVDNHIYPGLPGVRFLERWLESRWCQFADVITTVSKPLAKSLCRKYGEKVQVIYNGFDVDDYEYLPPEKVLAEEGLISIVYTGTIYKGKRDPSPLFKAVRELSNRGLVSSAQLKIFFCGYNADASDLAEREGVGDFFEYLGFLPRKDTLRLQRDASALLFLEYDSNKVEGILTGKIFEYLIAGPPVFGVGIREDSSVGILLKETGKGISFGNDVQKIKFAVLALYENQLLKKYDLFPKVEILEEYTRENQAMRMINLVKN